MPPSITLFCFSHKNKIDPMKQVKTEEISNNIYKTKAFYLCLSYYIN